MTLLARMHRHFTMPSPTACWLWTGAREGRGRGHGKVRLSGPRRLVSAARLMWEQTVGVIPEGLHVLHRCDEPACVNPSHLELGTHGKNMRDMWTRGRGRSGFAIAAARKTL